MLIKHTFSEEVLNEVNLTEEVLELLDGLLINPLVAGGAPRDWFFNKTATDIDIFVDKETDFSKLNEELQKNPDIKKLDCKTNEDLSANYRSEYILGVTTFTYCEKIFQIIRTVDKSSNIIKTFPVSISRITYKNYSIHPSKVFLATLSSATLLRTSAEFTPYIRKIANKFPNFRCITVSLEYLNQYD